MPFWHPNSWGLVSKPCSVWLWGEASWAATSSVVHMQWLPFREGPSTTTTIILQQHFASDVASNRHLMAHQRNNLCVFSLFHCVEGAFDVSSRGTPKLKYGVPRDELKVVVVVFGPLLSLDKLFNPIALTLQPCTLQNILNWWDNSVSHSHATSRISSPHKFLRVACLQNEVGAKFVLSLRKMLRNFPRDVWAFISWVRKIPQNSRQISHIISLPRIKITGELLQERREKDFHGGSNLKNIWSLLMILSVRLAHTQGERNDLFCDDPFGKSHSKTQVGFSWSLTSHPVGRAFLAALAGMRPSEFSQHPLLAFLWPAKEPMVCTCMWDRAITRNRGGRATDRGRKYRERERDCDLPNAALQRKMEGCNKQAIQLDQHQHQNISLRERFLESCCILSGTSDREEGHASMHCLSSLPPNSSAERWKAAINKQYSLTNISTRTLHWGKDF